MKVKVSDYIADFLSANGVSHVFSITGGGAIHLNDSIGKAPGLNVVYNHHEQACAIAAESYARINNKIALVCVTTGPGGTNALTGVVGGWLDSIPMLIISGQVRYDTTARSSGLDIRALGDQEFDITKAAQCMTKYCEMITEPKKIKYCLEKALYIAQSGRPGPCWLDIPLNVQGAYIETGSLDGFDKTEINTPPAVSKQSAEMILESLRGAKRPVLYAGNGVNIANARSAFLNAVDALNIPVVTTWNAIDLIYDKHPLYVGRAGMMGDRAGNFAVQNSDLIIAVGNRLSIRQVGYTWKTWARAAKVIMCDADRDEMKKPTLHVDEAIWCDAKDLLEKLAKNRPVTEKTNDSKTEWRLKCAFWKNKYPVVEAKHYSGEELNVYAFIKELSLRLPEGKVTVVGNGSACVVGSHAYVIKENSRFIINSGAASMGYDLPAAIGAHLACETEVICVTGDGSIQMNLQELQTIKHHNMPVKIFVINNGGYHSIRQTQENLFEGRFTGIGYASADLSFPDMGKIALAYGIPYFKCSKNGDLNAFLSEVLEKTGAVIAEVFVTAEQVFEPKSATKKEPDGTLTSPPLEDLAPFLSREELRENMIIDMQ
ncbi:MAG: thiamine pyrophosphate-binding protein [Clostridiales bacterium]|jgi:acetolactate synthase-1/2/3 large subunit|nr:thiamine pyrophosphate-binding protein [Clostridiales bacterium]